MNLLSADRNKSLLSIFTGALIADASVVAVIRLIWNDPNLPLFEWYRTFRLGAGLADVLVAGLGVVFSRWLYLALGSKHTIWGLLALTVVLQVIHDLLWAAFCMSVPKGYNYVLDYFKKYVCEAGAWALLGDALIVCGTVLLANWLVTLSHYDNVLILLFASYVCIYLLYGFFPKARI